MEAVLSRTTLLIERALRNPEAQVLETSGSFAMRPHRHALSFALRNLAADCAGAIFHLCFHWSALAHRLAASRWTGRAGTL